jgi:hypothetical protein
MEDQKPNKIKLSSKIKNRKSTHLTGGLPDAVAFCLFFFFFKYPDDSDPDEEQDEEEADEDKCPPITSKMLLLVL